MEETANVSKLPLPSSVVISDAGDLRLTPNQMRALKAETGKTLEELMGEGADDADRLQAVAWLQLRREGFDVRWDELGDIAVEFKADEPDPTNAARSASLPPFAGSGA